MAYEPIETKKFLNSTGVGHLWDKIKERYDNRIANVQAADDSISVDSDAGISVQISAEEGNLLQLKTTGNKGLYVQAPDVQDTYAVVKATNSGDYAAVYQLMKYTHGSGQGTKVGVDINIPKDMVVQSGSVETKSGSGAWGPAGTYIHLVLANADQSDLYINVSNLIEYVTSGSQAGDAIMIDIDSQHRVTATISDNSITSSKLDPNLRSQIALGQSAVQNISEGSTNGTIDVDGNEVPVHGLGTAAFMASSAFDAAGAANAILGSSTDTAATMTVHGVKQYASDVYTAVQALSNAEIDAAISNGVNS